MKEEVKLRSLDKHVYYSKIFYFRPFFKFSYQVYGDTHSSNALPLISSYPLIKRSRPPNLGLFRRKCNMQSTLLLPVNNYGKFQMTYPLFQVVLVYWLIAISFGVNLCRSVPALKKMVNFACDFKKRKAYYSDSQPVKGQLL